MEPTEKCPKCKQPDITGGPVEIEGGEVTQEVHCECCYFHWTEVWKWYSRR